MTREWTQSIFVVAVWLLCTLMYVNSGVQCPKFVSTFIFYWLVRPPRWQVTLVLAVNFSCLFITTVKAFKCPDGKKLMFFCAHLWSVHTILKHDVHKEKNYNLQNPCRTLTELLNFTICKHFHSVLWKSQAQGMWGGMSYL